MLRYVLLKLGRALVVVWGAFTASFILLYMMPASPVELLFPPDSRDSITPREFAKISSEYGFNQPVIVQYFHRLLDALHGNFGNSVVNGQPVLSAMGDVLPNTIELAASALVLAILLSIVIAWTATYTDFSWLRNLVATIPPLMVSVPSFLLGLIIVEIFAFRLGWFPPISGPGLSGLVMPAVALSIPVAGPIAQLLLRNFTVEYGSPYVLTSFSKGLRKGKVLRTEVLRNACLPALTQAGLIVGELLAGSVITETIFSRAGIGRLTEQAVQAQDIPTVQGVVMFVAACFVTVNFIVDVSYAIIDPRLRAISASVRVTP
jgi:peptide/nickel transport system permease protein